MRQPRHHILQKYTEISKSHEITCVLLSVVVTNARRAPAYIPRHAIRIPICPAFSCAMLVVQFFLALFAVSSFKRQRYPGFKYFDVVTHHKIWIFPGRCCDICIESLTSSMQSSRSVFLFTKPTCSQICKRPSASTIFFFANRIASIGI